MAPLDWMAVRMFDFKVRRYRGRAQVVRMAHTGGGVDRTERKRDVQAQAQAQQDNGACGCRSITTVETSVHAAEMTVPRRQIVWFPRGGSVKCVGDVRESRVGMTSRRTVQYLLGRYVVSLDGQKDMKGETRRDDDDKDCGCDSVTTTMTTRVTVLCRRRAAATGHRGVDAQRGGSLR